MSLVEGLRRQEQRDGTHIMTRLMLEDPKKKDELNVVNRKKGLSTFYEGDKELLAQYCKIMKPHLLLTALMSCSPRKMGILPPSVKLMKDQVAGLRNDTSIVEGQELHDSLLTGEWR